MLANLSFKFISAVANICAGANVYGQLGLGSQDPTTKFTSIPKMLSLEVVAMQAGDYTSAAITEDGHVWLWGRNTHCQLGTGDDISQWTPVKLKGFKAVHPGE
jgi:alpha-tubulin suppressor-like RCC1 family protein